MAVNRTKTPWVILHGHRPIYTCDSQPQHLVSIWNRNVHDVVVA